MEVDLLLVRSFGWHCLHCWRRRRRRRFSPTASKPRWESTEIPFIILYQSFIVSSTPTTRIVKVQSVAPRIVPVTERCRFSVSRFCYHFLASFLQFLHQLWYPTACAATAGTVISAGARRYGGGDGGCGGRGGGGRLGPPEKPHFYHLYRCLINCSESEWESNDWVSEEKGVIFIERWCVSQAPITRVKTFFFFLLFLFFFYFFILRGFSCNDK